MRTIYHHFREHEMSYGSPLIANQHLLRNALNWQKKHLKKGRHTNFATRYLCWLPPL